MSKLSPHDIERMPLRHFTESAYLNYSMYVIMDRALPFIGDGLKPVQRRIVYAMSELGLSANAKFKKSARTVGDVLGKYHPHGDSACYEAMVLMAQPFSYNYPLIDGQGNWGAPDDPKSFAAMRYTESRLSAYSSLLLSELGQGTVDYVANFDGSFEEPKMLPARLPNILLNGTTGIAVGMATDIPSHNLREVAQAVVTLLDNPNATLESLMEHIQGPDYPTAAEIITPRTELYKMYQTGKGGIRMRAVWESDDGEVIITALPYQVSGAKVLEQIAQHMRAKKFPLIEDLRDESNHEDPVRLVITLKPKVKGVDIEQLMYQLCAITDLEKSYRINMNMLGLDHRPQVKGLVTILREWLTFRRSTVKRRLNYRLDRILRRLHILEGLLVAYLNLDEFIDIIRYEEEPASILMQRFALTEIQVEAILDLKLRHLAKLEETKLRAEAKILTEEKEQLQGVLASERRLNTLIKKEILADSEMYGCPRRSEIIERQEARTFSIQSATSIVPEPITVILSKMGWVRALKGHDVLETENYRYRTGDAFLSSAQGFNHVPVIFIDSTGRSYGVDPQTLPLGKVGQGEPLSGKLTLPNGASVTHMLMGEETQKFIMASDAGYGFICHFNDLVTRNRSGKALLTLPLGAKGLPPLVVQDQGKLLLSITLEGRMLLFPVSELPHLSKGKGNKIIAIPNALHTAGEDKLIHMALVAEGSTVTLYAGKRKLTLKTAELQQFMASRGRRGTKLPRGLQRVTRIVVE